MATIYLGVNKKVSLTTKPEPKMACAASCPTWKLAKKIDGLNQTNDSVTIR